MKGDFSRVTFDPSKHFLRVLMQQGRVQLDADWNEQIAILLHYMQTLAKDIIGEFGGPSDLLGSGTDPNVLEKRCGFEIIKDPNRIDKFLELSTEEKDRLKALLGETDTRFLIGKGRYYVDGLLCRNRDYIPYNDQPDYLEAPAPSSNLSSLVYLDVWERHLTMVEAPQLREVALGGPDTASRSKVVCQVKIETQTPANFDQELTCENIRNHWAKWVHLWQPAHRGKLKARTKPSSKPETDPCNIAPESRYRGPENQLYRVEIHTPGAANAATFKWSRENGAVIFPVTAIVVSGEATTVTLAHLGRDSRFSLAPGDWVELMDDKYVLHASAEPLLKVIDVDPAELQVTLEGATSLVFDEGRHPLLRRWDHKEGNPARGGVTLEDDGAILITEGVGDTDWLNLEDGIQIQFQPAPGGNAHRYRTGDYWLIPARTKTGEIEWPTEENAEGKLVPTAERPHGVEHHYAPLAVILTDTPNPENCRCCFDPSCVGGGGAFLIEQLGMRAPAVEEVITTKAEADPLAQTAAKPKLRAKPKPRAES